MNLYFIKSKKNRHQALEISDAVNSMIIDYAKRFFKCQGCSDIKTRVLYIQPDICVTFNVEEKNESILYIGIIVEKQNIQSQCIFGYEGKIDLNKDNKLYISKFTSINNISPTDEIYTFLESLN